MFFIDNILFSCLVDVFFNSRHTYGQGIWEGGSAGTSVLGPESQEGACESLKDQLNKKHLAALTAYVCHFFV